MNGLSLVGMRAVDVVEKLTAEKCVELQHYNKAIGIIVKIPQSIKELYAIMERIREEYLQNEK